MSSAIAGALSALMILGAVSLEQFVEKQARDVIQQLREAASWRLSAFQSAHSAINRTFGGANRLTVENREQLGRVVTATTQAAELAIQEAGIPYVSTVPSVDETELEYDGAVFPMDLDPFHQWTEATLSHAAEMTIREAKEAARAGALLIIRAVVYAVVIFGVIIAAAAARLAWEDIFKPIQHRATYL